MACCAKSTLLGELTDLVNQIGAGSGECCDAPCCSPPPCCVPCTMPYAQVVMTCPPPCLAPTVPEPVKPLQLPCLPQSTAPQLTPDEIERSRFDNFYNNYNIDWHDQGKSDDCCCCPPSKPKRICEDYTKTNQDDCSAPGCPTGFKPCSMKLTPPPGCHPCGVWCAQVQPCPPKPKKKSTKYEPGPCTRKCCKHWEPKEGPCLYDDPCKAHCFNHPPGMKPSGRYP